MTTINYEFTCECRNQLNVTFVFDEFKNYFGIHIYIKKVYCDQCGSYHRIEYMAGTIQHTWGKEIDAE